MKVIYIVIFFLILQSCSHNKAPVAKPKPSVNDTDYLKTVKWDSLNTYVKYHILKKGVTGSDAGLRFKIETLVCYYYYKSGFEYGKNEEIPKLTPDRENTTNLKPAELSAFILSDYFTKQRSLDCLLKVNSEIYYQLKPSLLKRVLVRVKAIDDKNITILRQKLTAETFTQTLTLKTQRPNSLDSLIHKPNKTLLKNSSFFEVEVKPGYRTLSKLQNICDELNKWPEVENAHFVDMFTGRGKFDMIWRVTSN